MNLSSALFKMCRTQPIRPKLAHCKTSRCLQSSRQLSSTRALSVQPEPVSGQSVTSQADVLSSLSPQTEASFQTATAQASTETLLNPSSATMKPATSIQESTKYTERRVGTVTRAGTMKQTVVVSSNRQQFDKWLKKHYTVRSSALVHDPQDTLVEGDVVTYTRFTPDEMAERVKRGRKNIRFVVQQVITPFGLPVEQRIPRVTRPNPDKPTSQNGLAKRPRKALTSRT